MFCFITDWFPEAEKVAYGPLNLKPWEFEALTPGQLMQMITGWDARQKEEWRRTAWLAAAMINIWLPRGKKIKNPDELLGLDKPEGEEKKKDAEKARRDYEELKKRRGKTCQKKK